MISVHLIHNLIFCNTDESIKNRFLYVNFTITFKENPVHCYDVSNVDLPTNQLSSSAHQVQKRTDTMSLYENFMFGGYYQAHFLNFVLFFIDECFQATMILIIDTIRL